MRERLEFQAEPPRYRTLLALVAQRQTVHCLGEPSLRGAIVAGGTDDGDESPFETKARGESCKQEPDDDESDFRTLTRGERVGYHLL